MTLYHRSRSGSSSDRLGNGWSSDLTQHLVFTDGFVLWHTEDGAIVPFGQVGTAWLPLLGRYETLAHDAVAHTYTITRPDQSKLVFADAAPGRLKRVEDRFGNALTFVWNASSATATDDSGRATTIAIDNATDRITAVTDSAGRAWSFGYTSGELTSLTDPAGAATTLAYTSGDLTSVSRTRTLSGSPQTITWSFGYTSGKVTGVTDPEGGANSPVRSHTFAYTEAQTTASLLRDLATGSVASTTYELDDQGRVLRDIDPLGEPDHDVGRARQPSDRGCTSGRGRHRPHHRRTQAPVRVLVSSRTCGARNRHESARSVCRRSCTPAEEMEPTIRSCGRPTDRRPILPPCAVTSRC
jgi:YD repeat-containing protein